MNDLDRLKRVFPAYVEASGLSPLTVSRLFFGAGGRWAKVEAGGDMGSKVITRALDQFRREWPEGHQLPPELSFDVQTSPVLPAPMTGEAGSVATVRDAA